MIKDTKPLWSMIDWKGNANNKSLSVQPSANSMKNNFEDLYKPDDELENINELDTTSAFQYLMAELLKEMLKNQLKIVKREARCQIICVTHFS